MTSTNPGGWHVSKKFIPGGNFNNSLQANFIDNKRPIMKRITSKNKLKMLYYCYIYCYMISMWLQIQNEWAFWLPPPNLIKMTYSWFWSPKNNLNNEHDFTECSCSNHQPHHHPHNGFYLLSIYNVSAAMLSI